MPPGEFMAESSAGMLSSFSMINTRASADTLSPFLFAMLCILSQIVFGSEVINLGEFMAESQWFSMNYFVFKPFVVYSYSYSYIGTCNC